MKRETFQTVAHAFDPSWVDADGMIGNALWWAEKNLPVGHRVIGSRILTFNGSQDIYKFDFKHSAIYGIQLECEFPARSKTVVRVTRHQMIVIESESGSLVGKYLLFRGKDGKPVWRPWLRRTMEHHIEEDLPGLNLMTFLLQCNKVIRDVSRYISTDWLSEVRGMIDLPVHSETPLELMPYLHELQVQVDAWLDKFDSEADPEKIAAACLLFYRQILTESMARLRQVFNKKSKDTD